MQAKTLALWFVMLVAQNAAFTWASRARSSGSLSYHALAATFSNGIFFVTNLFLIGLVTVQGRPLAEYVGLAALYVAGTVTGSVLMHYVSMRWLEKGKRRIGAMG